MYTRESFTADAGRCRDAIRAIMPPWHESFPTVEDQYAYGFSMYENARRSSLGLLVLGDASIRGDRDLLVNLGVSSVTADDAAGVITGEEREERRSRGAVLNELHWWPFFNDCWVLGGIHGRMQFHLGREQWPADHELWNGADGCPRMLGRELMILSVAGYALEMAGSMGMVFRSADPARALGMRLADVYALEAGSDGREFAGRIKAAF